MPTERVNVVVIGAGPAGIAAGLQLQRYGEDPLVIERDRPGGLLWNAHWVENYLGFPEGITGPDLIARFEEQITSANLRILETEVCLVERSGGRLQVRITDGRIDARALVVASGTVPRPLPSHIRVECDEDRVFYEVKDLPEDRRERVAVLGGGDAAFDYALGLAREGARVEIFLRSHRPRALPLLVDRACRTPGIQVHAGTDVTGIVSGREGAGVELANGRRHTADSVLIAFGRDPNLGFLGETLRSEIDTKGPAHVPGLILAGDVRGGFCRQVAIAVGGGVEAAMRTASWLAEGPLSEDTAPASTQTVTGKRE